MLIAQITDMHVRRIGERNPFGVDANLNLAAAVDTINAMTPRPDVVLATGDLTNRGHPEEYAALDEILAPLAIPLYVIPGNHDDVETLRATFAAHTYLPREGPFLHYVVDAHDLRLVGLDTTARARHDGELCDDRLEWLEHKLSEAPAHATLVFMHHPPFPTGIWWMDGIGLLTGSDALQSLLSRHPQVVGIVCGHVHRSIHSTIGATPVSVAPSTAYQVHLDMTAESPPHFIGEPPAMHLHSFDAGLLVTHTAFIGHPSSPIDLRAHMPAWEERKALHRRRAPVPKKIAY